MCSVSSKLEQSSMLILFEFKLLLLKTMNIKCRISKISTIYHSPDNKYTNISLVSYIYIYLYCNREMTIFF